MTNPNDEAYSTEYNAGLTKRELAVLMAMQGLAATEQPISEIPKIAVALADATLAELNREKGE